VGENESCSCDNEPVCRSRQTEIFSVVYDRDGATVFMDPNGIAMFKLAVSCILTSGIDSS
jgi:hypothetical protein